MRQIAITLILLSLAMTTGCSSKLGSAGAGAVGAAQPVPGHMNTT